MVWHERAGPSSGPSVVLVHGSMDRSAGLLRLSGQLDRTAHVVRFDRRGYGRSSGLGPPWTLDANIGDLERLIESCSLDRPTVFGHSFGGNVALGVAARRPDLVGAVVVYETPLSWMDWWPSDSAGAAAMGAADPGAAAEAFMRRLIGDERWERLPAGTRADRRAEGPAMVAELADLRRAAPWRPELVSLPVLALRGELGRTHHRASSNHLAEVLANCRVEKIAGAGHAGPLTHSAAVAAAIEAFVSPPPRWLPVPGD